MTRIMIALLGGVLFFGTATAEQLTDKQALGRLLFFDVDLSAQRTQSCATCHDPEHGFADPRDSGVAGAASLGDDGVSLGDRNAPTASYAAFSPPFHIRAKDRKAVGGQFHDGRAATLADQAAGPPLNPLEMGMPSKAAVLARLLEKPTYREAFPALYGFKVLEDADAAYAAMADAVGEFEKTAEFSPFSSKYDRFLRGEVTLSPQEELGRVLFFSQQFTNCNLCHQLRKTPGATEETFTNYEFHNIGVPTNFRLRAKNGVQMDLVDEGLSANPAARDPGRRSRFKTPTLRNVAVTGPYMHNGIFQDLRTVVVFYNQYNSKSASARINPETGVPWGVPETMETLSVRELTHGPALDDKRIDALVAFMKTLTDQRYEHLLTP